MLVGSFIFRRLVFGYEFRIVMGAEDSDRRINIGGARRAGRIRANSTWGDGATRANRWYRHRPAPTVGRDSIVIWRQNREVAIGGSPVTFVHCTNRDNLRKGSR